MTVLSTQRLQAIMEDRWRDLTGGTEPPQIVAHLAAAIVDSLLFAELTGHPARRKLGAGRADDTGDIDGVPATVVQVANWADVARAVREKPTGAETQRRNAGVTFACTWVRFRGGLWRVVLTPEQWATYHRETL